MCVCVCFISESDRLSRPALGQVLHRPTQHLRGGSPQRPAGAVGQGQGNPRQGGPGPPGASQQLHLLLNQEAIHKKRIRPRCPIAPLSLSPGRSLQVLPGARGLGGDGASTAGGPAGTSHPQPVSRQRNLQAAAQGPHPQYAVPRETQSNSRATHSTPFHTPPHSSIHTLHYTHSTTQSANPWTPGDTSPKTIPSQADWTRHSFQHEGPPSRGNHWS